MAMTKVHVRGMMTKGSLIINCQELSVTAEGGGIVAKFKQKIENIKAVKFQKTSNLFTAIDGESGKSILSFS